MSESFVELDVRPTLRAGGEPFAEIMAAVSKLEPGQGLRLYATFEPVPLFHALGSKGFTHEARELDQGEWEVLFRPSEDAAAAKPAAEEPAPKPATAADTDTWPEPAQHMDNRELDPPEPMVRILAATEEMQPGQVLSAFLCREPMFLIPELDKRGHAWRGGFEPDGTAYKIMIRVADAQTAAS